MSEIAYVAFGSNMGDGEMNIREAAGALERVPGIFSVQLSQMYITKPWGYENQDNFVNAAARLETSLSPEALLGVCLGIEAGMGRVRKITNGPRVIDIDVLIYNNEIRDTKELKLPHPFLYERDFVLEPLQDVAEGELKEKVRTALSEIKDRYVL